MDIDVLRSLASTGMEGFHLEKLGELVELCDHWSIASGESRYSIIGDGIQTIYERSGEQGIPAQLQAQVDNCLRWDLWMAIEAEDTVDAARLASIFRASVTRLNWSPTEWVALGWLRKSDWSSEGCQH